MIKYCVVKVKTTLVRYLQTQRQTSRVTDNNDLWETIKLNKMQEIQGFGRAAAMFKLTFSTLQAVLVAK